MICQNCNSKHGCGCQARIASDGRQCCTLCINKYEASISNKIRISQQTSTQHSNTQLGLNISEPQITSIRVNKKY